MRGIMTYRKHQHISPNFLLKIFVSNQRCGLFARTSEDHAINLHKTTLFSKDFTICIDLCCKTIRTAQNYTTVRLLMRVWGLLKEPFLFILTSLALPFLSSWMSLGREPLFTSCLHCCWWPFTSTEINPSMSKRKYAWQTASFPVLPTSDQLPGY